MTADQSREVSDLKRRRSKLKGPLGEASSTQVSVEDSKVVGVCWSYAAKYKTAAEALWKSDNSYMTKVAMWITLGKKELPDGNAMWATCTTGENELPQF